MDFIQSPDFIKYALMFLNLFLIESLLSIDNAAVLAAMVQHLPEERRKKALKYGIIGAYVFRGIALLSASYLMKIIWIKIAGGAWLLWIAAKYFYEQWEKRKSLEAGEAPEEVKEKTGWLSSFWGTVLMVEIMDMAFSVDNVFAAVAMTTNLYVIMGAVGLGILAMRFAAQHFSVLMEKYPFLEGVTFGVIILLGLKLVVSGIFDYQGDSAFKTILNGHYTDLLFSIAILVIFFVPVVVVKLRKKKDNRVLLHG